MNEPCRNVIFVSYNHLRQSVLLLCVKSVALAILRLLRALGDDKIDYVKGMELLFRYLRVFGLAILGAVIIISYQSYKAKSSNQSVERYINPLIDSKLNALVIDKSVVDASDRIQSSNAMMYSLRVSYIDLGSGQSSNFVTKFRYGKDIALGDTITKRVGDEELILHKKGGRIFTLPIEQEIAHFCW